MDANGEQQPMASLGCRNRAVRGRANNKEGGKMGKKKRPNDVVLGAGVAMSIVTELSKRAKGAGLIDEDLHRLATPEGGPLLDRFVDLMVQANNPFTPIKTVEVVHLPVDYSRKLKEWVEEWYRSDEDHLQPDITQSRFFDRDMAGVKERPLFLIHFDTCTLNAEALAEFARRRINPASLAELFAFSIAFPKVQHRSPVVALGKPWEAEEGPCVSMLTSNGNDGRNIILGEGEPGHCWPGDTRFLAVRY